jgi:PAS domain S-box-containing protein
MKKIDKSKEELLLELEELKKEIAVLKEKNTKNKNEQNHSEAYLNIGEEDYQNLFERHTAVNLIIDPDTGDIVKANKAAAEYYGWTCEELMKMKIQQINIMPPEEIKANLLKTKNQNKFHFEFKHKRANGSIRNVEVFSSNIKIEGRNLLYSIVFDITERKQFEEALKESESCLIRAEQIVKVGNWKLIVDSGEIISSVGAQLIYGVDKGTLSLEYIQKLSLPEYRPLLDKALDDLIYKNTGYNIEFKIQRLSDGKIIDIHSVADYDKENKIVFGIIRDITEYNKDKEELSESEHKFKDLYELNQKIIHASSIGIFACRADGPCIIANEAVARISGSTVENMLQLNYNELETWKLNGLYEKVKRSLETECEQRIEINLTTTFGKEACLDFMITPFISKGISHFLMLVDDITARKQAEEEIKYKNEQLLKLNSEKDKFFSIISHDLKSPFQGLIGYSQILIEEYNTLTDEEKKDSIKSIFDLSKNTFELLDNLLIWSRIQTGKMIFDPDVFNIYQELLPTIELLIHVAKKKDINIDFIIDKRIIVPADKNMLSTVVRNLISNAIKFSYPGGKIVVSAERVNKDLEVSVSDNGVGIQERVINNLFKVDQNVSTNGTAQEEGTGLGLILCKEMIEMHRGKIWIESKVGKGSKFTFSIPIKK